MSSREGNHFVQDFFCFDVIELFLESESGIDVVDRCEKAFGNQHGAE